MYSLFKNIFLLFLVFKVFTKFEGIRDATLNLVEVSPKLSEMQRAKLTGEPLPDGSSGTTDMESKTSRSPSQDGPGFYQHCHSKHGQNVRWYNHLNDVPPGYSIYIAHEFFDALPIHKFLVSCSII